MAKRHKAGAVHEDDSFRREGRAGNVFDAGGAEEGLALVLHAGEPHNALVLREATLRQQKEPRDSHPRVS